MVDDAATFRAEAASREADRFADDLSLALRDLAGNQSRIGNWQQDIADACLCDRSTVQRWQSGDTTPESWRLTLLFDHLGIAFEGRVRGRVWVPHDASSYRDGANDTIESMISHLQEMRDGGRGG